MPAVDRPGKKGVYLELEPALLARVRDLAERNGRAFNSELSHALERHLGAPPTVTVTVVAPELPPATVETAPTPKRGRPKKKA